MTYSRLQRKSHYHNKQKTTNNTKNKQYKKTNKTLNKQYKKQTTNTKTIKYNKNNEKQ